jgi:hypothetical protein
MPEPSNRVWALNEAKADMVLVLRRLTSLGLSRLAQKASDLIAEIDDELSGEVA